MANEVTVTVRGRDQGATKTIDDAGKALTNVGNVAKGILAANLIQDIGRNAQRFLGQAAQAASGLEQAVGGTKAVFGDAAGAVDAYGEHSAQSAGLSERAFREATTLIGGQLKRMTGDVEFASDASIQLVEVGADLAATYGGTTKQAVDAFAAALRGEADPAERFNLNLKVSAVNAKAVELGLAASTSEVDDNAKAQALLALVLEQSSDAQGQFARESDTAAGAAQRSQAAWEDAQATLGQQLLPLMAGLGQAMSTAAAGFGQLPGPVQAAAGAVVLLSTGLLVLAPRILAAKVAMKELELSARGLATAVGLPLAIITALTTAVTIAAQEWQAATVPADKLAEDLERLAASGRETGVVTELLGRDVSGLAGSLQQAADDAQSNWLDRNFVWSPAKRKEVNQAVEDVAALDTALAQIAAAGGDSEAAFNALTTAAGLTDAQIDELRKLLPQYREEQQRANERTQDGEQAQTGAMEADLARVASLEAVADTLRAQMDPAFALIRALEDQEEAQRAATEAEDEHGKNSPEYRAALRDEARAALDVLDAAGKLGDEFTGELSDAQRKMLKDAGLSAAAVRQLEDDLEDAKREADRLDGTRVVVETVLRYRYEIIGQAPTALPGGPAQAFAHGGVVGATSQAQGGGPRGNRVLMGEHRPEVVELAPGSRVIPSVDQASDRGQMNGFGGGGGVLEVRAVVGSGDELMDAIVRRLQFRVRTEGGGSAVQLLERR